MSLSPCNIRSFLVSLSVIFFYSPLCNFFYLPPNRPNKNQLYFQEIFVFVWPIRGVNNIFFIGGESKKNLQREKPEMIYITWSKNLLTLKILCENEKLHKQI